MAKVKICGITNADDARVAVAAGADAIGFIFAESPRRVSPQQARDILLALPPGRAVPVGVFVNEPVDRMIDVARFVGLNVLQLHGDEPPEIVGELMSAGFDVVKSIRVSADKETIGNPAVYRPTAFLLDAFVAGRPGGTGRTFDWRVAAGAKRLGRVIVSGGLGVDNVLDAVRVASPYGVDASSRLEIRPGVKDHELVREFIRRVKPSAEDAEAEPWPR
jgi:phosphoribosylanthranilate isomerase